MDVPALVDKAAMREVGAILRRPFFVSRLPRKNPMNKKDAQQLLKRALRQHANTSGGGHLGGTNHGQGYDAKTTSGSKTATRRPAKS
jgi:hypothetical protein